MEEWKTYRLSELTDLIAGFAFKSADFGDIGSPVVKIKDIQPPFISLDATDKVDISKYNAQKLEKYLISKGDFLMAMTGATIGKVGRYVDDTPSFLNQRVLKFVPKQIADKSFIYYVLLTHEFQSYVVNHIDSESAQPNISANTIGKFELRAPSLKSQIAISKILSSLDSKIELNRRINDNLEQQAQSAFDKLLEISASYGEQVQLSHYAEVNPTRKLSKGQTARCIDMSCLPTRGSFPSDWAFKPYEGGMKFINGDTIMARITPCLENGKTAYINFLDSNETAFGSTEYIVLHPCQGYASEMLYFLSRNADFVNYAVSNMNGSSGRQRVAGDDIAKYELPKFQDDDLSAFNAVAIPNMKIILNNSLQNRELVKLRDALLPKLMSSELKPEEINM